MDEQTSNQNEPRANEGREPLWIPYSTPPQSRGEHIGGVVRRYSFSIVLVVTVAFFAGVIMLLFPEVTDLSAGEDSSAETTDPQALLDRARAQRAAGGSAEATSASDSPYQGEAAFSISTRPMGATVLVGGDTLGVTPLRGTAVPAGAHLLSVRMDGYAQADSVVLFRNDRSAVAFISLEALAERSGTEPQPEAAPTDRPPPVAEAQQAAPETPPAQQQSSQQQSSQQQSSSPERSSPRRSAASSAASDDPEDEAAERSATASSPRAGPPAGTAPGAQAPPNPDSMFFEDEGLLRLYRAHMDRGNDLFVEEEYAAARDAYERALAVRPDDAKAVYRVKRIDDILAKEARDRDRYAYQRAQGDLLFEQERYAQAVERFENALQFKPNDPYVTRRLADSRGRAERAENAARAAEAARQTASEAARRSTGQPAPTGQERGAEPQEAAARMNLNTATNDQLQRLPGIGPTLAQRILDYRQSRGGFRSVRELEAVRGIGPKRMDELSPLLFVPK